MSIFSDKPGARERHLQRQYQNVLFGNPSILPDMIIQARQEDEQEVQQFMNDFRDLVQQVVDLKPNADAEVVLKIKEQLDKNYEYCSALAGDQSEVKNMLSRLLKMLMQAMWAAIGNDTQAHEKLQMEEAARQAHFELLEEPLIADLLNPESPISQEQLVPSLLSAKTDAVAKAMQIFSPEQQRVLYEQARDQVAALEKTSSAYVQASQALADMEAALLPGSTVN